MFVQISREKKICCNIGSRSLYNNQCLFLFLLYWASVLWMLSPLTKLRYHGCCHARSKKTRIISTAAISGAQLIVKVNVIASVQNKRNSLPWTVRTCTQRLSDRGCRQGIFWNNSGLRCSIALLFYH